MMLRTSRSLVALVACLATAQLAQATAISIFGTGLDASGNPLAAGASDTHYTVNENGGAAAVVVSSLPGSYFANNSSSQWIWQQANGGPSSVTRTFKTTFDLSAFDASSASISGLWGTDNTGLDILLNGVSLGITLPGSPGSNFASLHAFTITSGFTSNVNTLEFVVQDLGVVGAFRAQLSGDARLLNVPEPGSLAIVGLGLLALAATRKRPQFG